MINEEYFLIQPNLALYSKQALGYKKLRKFFCKDQGYPRLLYKYKSYSEGHLTDFIVNSVFYLSSFNEFNDPYDCKSKAVFSKSGKDRIKYLKALKKVNKTNYSKSKQMYRDLAGPIELEKGLKVARQGIIESTGIHSFSTKRKNLLMWSHYSNSHRGVCLIFDTARDPDVFSNALPITYSHEYPVIEHPNFQSKELITKSFLTKALEWGYEDERRIVLQNRVRQKLYFDPKSLFGIILGIKTTAEDVRMIKRLLGARKSKGFPDIKVLLALQSSDQYKLIYKRAKDF